MPAEKTGEVTYVKRKPIYIVKQLRKWEDIELQNPLGMPVSFQSPKGCVGVMLVFDDIDELMRQFPDITQSQIQLATVEEKPS